MEITNDSPEQYETFAMRRWFWQNLGIHYDGLSYKEVQEALVFMRLEREHPHRFKPKEN